jgi:hypothetical protein
VVRIWAKLRVDHPGRATLPLVVPLVVHQGARAWSAPTSLHDLVEGLADHPGLRPFVPNLDLLIDDLAVASDEQLMNHPLAPVARLAAWLLRDGRDAAAILAHMEAWAGLLAQVAAQHPGEIETLLRYILLAGGEQSVEEVRRSILLHVPSVEAALASAGEQLIQQGFESGLQRGVQQGIERGLLTGLRKTVRAQLTFRFGPLDAAELAAIDEASTTALEDMLLRVLTAANAAEVLAGT